MTMQSNTSGTERHTVHSRGPGRLAVVARRGVPTAALALAMGLTLSACVGPEGYRVRSVPAPAPQAPSTTVYFYPKHGQTKQQQDRDRYECYLWAVKETGYDPGNAPAAPQQRVQVEPATPPGQGTAVGAATGAVLGAAMSRPRHAGEGAVVGAITGAMLGAASDAARQEQAERIQQQYDRQADAQAAVLARRAADYRRAMAACLEGRGYTVR